MKNLEHNFNKTSEEESEGLKDLLFMAGGTLSISILIGLFLYNGLKDHFLENYTKPFDKEQIYKAPEKIKSMVHTLDSLFSAYK